MSPRREIHVLMAAIKVAERLGTWVIYRLATVEHAHLVGYIRLRLEDFERRRDSTASEERAALYNRRIGHWRRANRLLSQIDPEHAQDIGRRLVEAIESHPEWSGLPFCSPDDVDPKLVPASWKLNTKAPRRLRAVAQRTKARSQVCRSCDGIGYVT